MSKKSPPARPTPPQASDAGVHLHVRVQPKASRESIRVDPSGRIKVCVTALPAGGAANAAVCALLAHALGVPKSSVQIVRGHAAREKLIAVAGITAERAAERVRALAQS